MIRLLSLATALMVLTGCASVEMASLPAVPLLEDKPDPVPQKVIPVWTDTVLHRGGQAVRGFGGRVIFYGEKQDQPVQVDGLVIVYAWDDTGETLRESPDRKYVFKADELSKHYSVSKVGHSYSFWLPWDKVGGPTRHVTLITRFVSAGGGEVTSGAAHVVLPGPLTSATGSREEPRPAPEHEPREHEPPVAAATHETLSDAPRELIRQLTFEELMAEDEPLLAEPQRHNTESTPSRATTIELPLHMAIGDGRQPDIVDLGSESGASESGWNSLAAAGRAADRKHQTAWGHSAESVSGSSAEPETQDRLADRYARQRLPVRSRQSSRQSDPRGRWERLRAESRSRFSGVPKHRSLTVQQKIARDAAEAKARRDELWGRTGGDPDRE